MFLRQNTASQEAVLGRFLDSVDGNTEETGLTINNTDIKVWKGGTTSLVDKNSGGATHMGGGVYVCTLDATDTNTVGLMELHTHVAGALATKASFYVLEEAVYDAIFGATAPGYVANAPVVLANAAHGGVAATLTLERAAITVTTLNESALKLTGNGLGSGLFIEGGSSAGANSVRMRANGTGGAGLFLEGSGTGAGLRIDGGANGSGFEIFGGGSAGSGIRISTTSGSAVLLVPSNGHGIAAYANGLNTHGCVVSGGTAGVCDGFKAVAGAGGADIRGNITGNVIGSVASIGTDGITTTSFADGAITDAKFNFPAESAGIPTTFMAICRRIWEWNTNKRTRDRNTGTVLLRNAADLNTLETQTQSTVGTVDTISKGV